MKSFTNFWKFYIFFAFILPSFVIDANINLIEILNGVKP